MSADTRKLFCMAFSSSWKKIINASKNTLDEKIVNDYTRLPIKHCQQILQQYLTLNKIANVLYKSILR